MQGEDCNYIQKLLEGKCRLTSGVIISIESKSVESEFNMNNAITSSGWAEGVAGTNMGTLLNLVQLRQHRNWQWVRGVAA